MGETRYLYSVHPKRIIKNLSDTIPVIRTNKTLSLTLEEVLTCVRSAVVYRRFANENRNERVTIANAERLHNAKFMTEAEYKEFLEKNSKPQEKKEEPKQPVVPEPVKEKVKEEEKKETVAEIQPVVIEEEKVEEKKESVVVVEEKPVMTGTVTDYSNSVLPSNQPQQNQNNNKDYGGRNKKHH